MKKIIGVLLIVSILVFSVACSSLATDAELSSLLGGDAFQDIESVSTDTTSTTDTQTTTDTSTTTDSSTTGTVTTTDSSTTVPTTDTSTTTTTSTTSTTTIPEIQSTTSTTSTASTTTTTSSSANENMPNTGVAEDYAVIAFAVVCVAIAVFAFRKIRNYNVK